MAQTDSLCILWNSFEHPWLVSTVSYGCHMHLMALAVCIQLFWSVQSSPQEVVTYTLPVEVFATRINKFDRRKSSLIAWSLSSEALDRLILREFKGQNVAMPAKYLRKCVDRLILVAQNSSWSLDRLLKRALIAWFHFDPGCKRFSRQRLCDYIDYPLSPVHSLVQSRVQVLQRPLFLCS